MKELFYEDLQQKPIHSRKKASKGNLTLDDDALQKIASREPMLRPFIRRISEYRSLGVFRSTFVEAELDVDSKLRCSYNLAGTKTFRLASSENAFGSGTNLANIPKGGEAEGTVDPLELPNVRTLFIPDVGYTFFECDLDRADLQIVVAEAGDAAMRRAMDSGVDMHLFSARDIFGLDIPDDEIVESHAQCRYWKERYHAYRQKSKAGVHATNYYCQPPKLAATLGISVHEATRFQTAWFSAHPGIKEWQLRTETALRTKRMVKNQWGYQFKFFDRVDDLLPEALAWIPQSSVAIYINKVWAQLYRNAPAIQVLLQVHDSLAGQFPTVDHEVSVARITALASTVAVPYNVPLVIPLGIKTSTTSWGDCK
jgi:DNA polymerase-1